MAKDKTSKAKETINDRINKMNKFTLEDFKTMGEKIYSNKPLFTGTVVGAAAFLLTSAGVFASIGAAALAGYGIKKLRGNK